jgi:ammonia channel protein AmtB
VGWIGFCAVWIFNGTFVIMFIVDAILNCRKSNREIMDEARRVFYYEKIKNYEK